MAALRIAIEKDAYDIGGSGSPVANKCLTKDKVFTFGNVKIIDSQVNNYTDKQLVAVDHLTVNVVLNSITLYISLGLGEGPSWSDPGEKDFYNNDLTDSGKDLYAIVVGNYSDGSTKFLTDTDGQVSYNKSRKDRQYLELDTTHPPYYCDHFEFTSFESFTLTASYGGKSASHTYTRTLPYLGTVRYTVNQTPGCTQNPGPDDRTKNVTASGTAEVTINFSGNYTGFRFTIDTSLADGHIGYGIKSEEFTGGSGSGSINKSSYVSTDTITVPYQGDDYYCTVNASGFIYTTEGYYIISNS